MSPLEKTSLLPPSLQTVVSWPAFVRCLPFAVFMLILAMRGALEGLVDTRWLYALQAGGAALALALLAPHYRELSRDLHDPGEPGRVSLSNLLPSIALGLFIAALWVLRDASWMRMGGASTSFVPTDDAGEVQIALVAVRLAGACLVVPLMEELFWRSFLMRWLDRRDFLRFSPREASLFAFVGSSAVFALAHDRWLAAFIAGLLFAAIYRHTKQIWQAVSAHATANLTLGVYVVHQRAWNLW
ncbi:MAG: CAAX prenyl protease-related protein [Caldimonas sp.]